VDQSVRSDAHAGGRIGPQLPERRIAIREQSAAGARSTRSCRALYQLALAYADAVAWFPRDAKCCALEQAPNYSKAQDLLLRIRSARPPGNE
jgi:hypothetical protein